MTAKAETSSATNGRDATGKAKREAILIADFEPHALADGVHVVPTQGNGLVVETDL